MKNCTKRWLYLLAGSSLSGREVREVCAWLANGSPDDIVTLVMQLRRRELGVSITPAGAQEEAGDAASRQSPRVKGSGVGQDLAAEVARILRTESHLSAREAAERLAMELKRALRHQSKAPPDIPAYSRESFRTYVGKLLKYTSPSMLLHLAHRIRDGVVGRPVPAWPLRSSGR